MVSMLQNSSKPVSITRMSALKVQHEFVPRIGISDKPGTVFIRSQEFTLEPLLTKQGSRHQVCGTPIFKSYVLLYYVFTGYMDLENASNVKAAKSILGLYCRTPSRMSGH